MCCTRVQMYGTTSFSGSLYLTMVTFVCCHALKGDIQTRFVSRPPVHLHTPHVSWVMAPASASLFISSLKEEALKDVLEDSDSENELGLAQSSSTAPDTIGRQSPISTSVSTFSEDLSTSRHANIVTAATAAATTATKPVSEAQIIVGHSTASEQRRTPQGCYVNILPPDLLLQCAEFLGDVLTLSRVREVSLGWLVALDRREGGRRLWRPVFYRLRASGSIHATTDTNGQQRRSLKVYDLFGASSGATKASTATTVTSSREGTPSPSRAAQRWSSVGGEFARQNSRLSVGAETGGNPASEAGSGQGSSPPLRRSSACLVCGLIQRQGYTGSDCEMCSSSLMLLPSSVSPTTPRVPYTRVNLTESADVKQRPTGKSKLHSLASAPEIPTATVNARWGGGGSNVHGSTYRGDVEDVEDMGEGGDVDWHFLVKKLAEEKRIASGWGSLHHGWVWLQHALEVRVGPLGPVDENVCSFPQQGRSVGLRCSGLGLRPCPHLERYWKKTARKQQHATSIRL